MLVLNGAFKKPIQRRLAPLRDEVFAPPRVTVARSQCWWSQTERFNDLRHGLARVALGLNIPMLLLIFGSTLIQQWEIASVQMIYIAFYLGLLATIRYDRFSLEGLRQRK